MCVCVCVCVERERERETDRETERQNSNQWKPMASNSSAALLKLTSFSFSSVISLNSTEKRLCWRRGGDRKEGGERGKERGGEGE